MADVPEEFRAPSPEELRIEPPTPLLMLAGLCILLGVVAAGFGGLALNAVGYASCSVFVVLLVGLFRRLDLRRRLNPYYSPRPALRRVASGLLVAGLVVAVWNAWAIATELSKR